MGDLPRYLDGPRFVKWLEEEGVKFSDLTDTQQRRWRDWEKGSRADLYKTADRILTDNYILPGLIPDECWSENQLRYENASRPPKKESDLRKAEGLMLVEAGVHVNEIADRLGVCPTTVRNWTRKQRQEQLAA